MNPLSEEAEDYLMIRRALGFKLRGHDRLLEDYFVFLKSIVSETITTESALAWATAPAGLSLVRWSQRLDVVRGFARHLHGLDSTVEVPPVDLLTCRRERPTPYLTPGKTSHGWSRQPPVCARPCVPPPTRRSLVCSLPPACE
jgi:integrase/recombinase XerD